MLSQMPRPRCSLMPVAGAWTQPVWEEDTVKTIEILDDMGHRMELGQIPEEDVERACGVIDSLAITGEAVTPVLTAQLRAFLAQSGIRLQGE